MYFNMYMYEKYFFVLIIKIESKNILQKFSLKLNYCNILRSIVENIYIYIT